MLMYSKLQLLVTKYNAKHIHIRYAYIKAHVARKAQYKKRIA